MSELAEIYLALTGEPLFQLAQGFVLGVLVMGSVWLIYSALTHEEDEDEEADQEEPLVLCQETLSEDAIALLKEQEARVLKESVPVVRCKDCKYYNTAGCDDGCGWCERDGDGYESFDDWFCAGGERKDNEIRT